MSPQVKLLALENERAKLQDALEVTLYQHAEAVLAGDDQQAWRTAVRIKRLYYHIDRVDAAMIDIVAPTIVRE